VNVGHILLTSSLQFFDEKFTKTDDRFYVLFATEIDLNYRLPMRKLITLVTILASIPVFAQEWQPLPMVNHTRIDDLCFVDENIGYTAGGWASTILKTTDAGESWTEIAKFDKYLRSIEFMDANIGLCGSLDGSLYRTIDGGENWEDIAPNIKPQPEGVCGLAKADANTIYGVGIWSEPAFVIKSTNKGETWTFIDMSAYAATLIDAYFFDADHGLVVGSKSETLGGIILYTADGGQTWTEKFTTHHLADRIWKIQSPDGIHFYASIETYTGNTRFLTSSDAGQTWESKVIDDDYFYIQSIGFIDPLIGWAGADDILFETRDGGKNWQQISVGSRYNRFVKINENTGYMSGARVYKYTRDLVTGMPDPANADPVHQLTITPNPTPGMTEVRAIFGNPTMAHIFLYDADGKSLKRIFDGHAGTGEKVIQIDLSENSAGAYIVLLKTNEGLVRTKFIKK
jgi:photosystem II stability/assembly factor-like uncharacterized protein